MFPEARRGGGGGVGAGAVDAVELKAAGAESGKESQMGTK